MKRLVLFALIITTLAITGAAQAQVNDTYVIPAAANVAGAYGTRWMTHFSIFNPQLDHALKVRIIYIKSNGLGSIEEKITIPANSVAYSENILDALFETSGTGALLVASFPEDNPTVPNTVLARSFLVTTETYNNSPAGTFGQTIGGVWAGLQDYEWDGISAVAHGIRNLSSQGWRTNVGAVNLGRQSVKMRVNVYDADGKTILKNAPFTLPPYGHVQDLLPIQVDHGSVEFFIDDPSHTAVVFPYTSTIDQLSGDPTYQSPTLLASAKELYGKSATAMIPMENPGKRIDLSVARLASEAAEHRGEAMLLKSATGGYTIGK
jgi:hypothetical protein